MIYVSDISDFDASFFDEAIELLPSEKKSEILNITHERSKKESVLAWILLRYILHVNGLDSFPPLFFTEKGKPYFSEGNPFFNLSHSNNKVVAAVSKEGKIGVDVQKESNFSPNMIKRVFCENEFVSAKSGNSLFTRLWAIKESYLKFTGTGIAYDLKSLDFSKGIENDYFVSDNLYFSVYKTGSYFISVCTNKKEWQEVFFLSAAELINYVKNNGLGRKGD